MNSFKTRLVFSIVFAIFLAFSCRENLEANGSGKQKLLILDQLQYSENPRFDELARFIGGKPLPENSPLLAITSTKGYEKYSTEVNQAWTNFETKHLDLVEKWIGDHPTTSCGENIFYPFSGPDILHALKFYPHARTLHMFALERLGGIPDPVSKNPEQEVEKLASILESIRYSLDYHYFITSYMSGKVGENEYSGVIGIMLFALARMEMTVLDVYPVRVTEAGRLERMNPAEVKQATSVAIFFRKPSEKEPRVVVYFKGDASDSGLAERPGLSRYLQSLSGYSTMLKAASYLMYDQSFDDMRTQILSQSKCVISDSSGIPYHYLANGYWDVSLYGVYKGPLIHFKNRFDPYLFNAIKQGAEPLPFDFGYRRGKGLSHIIFSRRKESFPVYAPVYDQSSTVGEMTSWNNNQFYRVYKPSEESIKGRLNYNEASKSK